MNAKVVPQSALRQGADCVFLRVRVTPKASKEALEGVETGANGVEYLKLEVRAVPDKGQANAAVIKLVAKALGVPKSAVDLASGATGRIKTLRIADLDETSARERLGL